MRNFQDRIAMVTGAASGIGRALCEALAKRGCDLALVDIDNAELAETAARVKRLHRRASVHSVDVSSQIEMERLARAIQQYHPRLDILINNAGVSLTAPFEATRLEDFHWIVGVNFWGVIYGCRFFLPLLRNAPQAHIVNVASDFACVGFPTKSGYCATKFAVRGFTETLRAELYGSNIGVTCAYPGAVATGLVQRGRAWDATKQKLEAQFVEQRGLSPEKVAKQIIGGIERNAARVFIGTDARLIDWMARFFPTTTNFLIARFRKHLPFI